MIGGTKMTAEGFTAATVYVPSEGAMMVAQKGIGELLPEYAEMGFTGYIDVSCNRFYCTESDEFFRFQIPLEEPFEELYPQGSEAALARRAVDYLYRGAEFQLLSTKQGD